jgi:hypothetical protein
MPCHGNFLNEAFIKVPKIMGEGEEGDIPSKIQHGQS